MVKQESDIKYHTECMFHYVTVTKHLKYAKYIAKL